MDDFLGEKVNHVTFKPRVFTPCDSTTCLFPSRYNELRKENKDAENHDYKSDWIPFWAQRVAQMFEEELQVE